MRFARCSLVLLAAAVLQGCGSADSEDRVAADPAIGEERALQDARAMIDERPESEPGPGEALPSPTPPTPQPSS